MTTESPFKFLDSYKKGEIDSFFGREEEVDIIYTYVHESNVLLINGPSGTGKSSIIQCGLASRFEKTDWLDVYIRRHNNINESLRESINEKNKKDLRPKASISESIKSLYLDYFKPIYLIFDQFEEIFILGDEKEQKEFFDNLNVIIKNMEIPCKVLLIMRERYIAQLQNFETQIPELFSKRVRIEYMRDESVKEVIGKTCDYHGISLEPREATIDEILKNIKIGNYMAELPHLQIYLDRLRKVGKLGTGKKVFSLDLVKKVGNIQSVLAAFLDERIFLVKENLKAKYPNKSQNLVEQLLIQFTSDDGTKKPRKGGEILTQSLDKVTAYFLINELITLGILRLEKFDKTQKDSLENIYEFTHDSLAIIIHNQLYAENNQIRRAIGIIKEGNRQYKPELFYFQRSFLSKQQLGEVDLMTAKIKENVPIAEQPTPQEWKIVNISKRNRIFRRVSVVLLPLLITITGFFYFSKLSSEKKTKFDILTDFASSPTQKYLLYKTFVNQANSKLFSAFNPKNSDEYTAISQLANTENLYYLSISNNDTIREIIYVQVKESSKNGTAKTIHNKKYKTRSYFVVVGKNLVNIYRDKTGEKLASERFKTKNIPIKLDSIDFLLNVMNNDSLSEYVFNLPAKNGPFEINLNKYNSAFKEVGLKEDGSLDWFFTETNSVFDMKTSLEYKFDHDYSYDKALFCGDKNNQNLIVADTTVGIIRAFNIVKTNGIFSEIDVNFLLEEKLKFYLDLTKNDYKALIVSENPEVQNAAWLRFEKDYITSHSFFNSMFQLSVKKQTEKNLRTLLNKIISKAKYNEIYALWRKLNNKIEINKSAQLTTELLAAQTKLEDKIGGLSEIDRNEIFRTVQIQSKNGAGNEHIKFFENMLKRYPKDQCVKILLAMVYSNASWFKLFEKKFDESLEYAKKGIAVKLPEEQLNYIYVNLSHAYFANNQIDKAKEIYIKYSKKVFYEPGLCDYIVSKDDAGFTIYNRKIMREDLKELENEGVFPEKLWGELETLKELLKDPVVKK